MAELAVGSTYYAEFDVVHPNGPQTGQPIAPDTTPTSQLVVNGVVDSTPPTYTIHNIALGKYSISFPVSTAFTVGSNVIVYINVLLNGIVYRRSLGNFTVTPQSVGSLGDSPVVSAEAVYNIFGQSNITKWADADNTENADTINSRIAWAINRAMLEIIGRLGKRYAVPFVNIPPLVVELICTRAGVILFRSPRGLVEGSDEGVAIKSIEDDANNRLAEILAGRLVLVGATGVTEPTSTPQVICDEQNSVSPFFPFVQHNQNFVVFPESLWYQT